MGTELTEQSRERHDRKVDVAGAGQYVNADRTSGATSGMGASRSCGEANSEACQTMVQVHNEQ